MSGPVEPDPILAGFVAQVQQLADDSRAAAQQVQGTAEAHRAAALARLAHGLANALAVYRAELARDLEASQ